MSLLYLILIIVVVGVVLWLVNNKIAMDPTVKTILNIVVIIILIVFLLKATGLWAALASVKI
jgi:hypothetical protein